MTAFGADGTLLACRGGVSSDEEVAALIERVLGEFGRLDRAFNRRRDFQCHKALHERSTSRWQDMIRVNLTGTVLRHESAVLPESGGGSIVNTASSLGTVAIAGAAEYIASKHGVVGLSRAATDYARRGLRVNAVLQ